MRRTLRAILILVLLLACLATAALWWRGQETTDCIDYTHVTNHGDTIISAYSWRGAFILEIRREPPTSWNRKYAGWAWRTFPSAHVWSTDHLEDLGRRASSLLGLRMGYAPFLDDSGAGPAVRAHSWMFSIPAGFPLVLLVWFPSLWLIRALRQRRRIALGRCTACGYDLRATADRCPECGQPVA